MAAGEENARLDVELFKRSMIALTTKIRGAIDLDLLSQNGALHPPEWDVEVLDLDPQGERLLAVGAGDVLWFEQSVLGRMMTPGPWGTGRVWIVYRGGRYVFVADVTATMRRETEYVAA